MMRYKRSPVALIAVFVGVGIGQILGIAPPFPALDFGLHLPHLIIPTWSQVLHGTEYAVLPQIPLTLTSAIIVTAAVSRQLFRKNCIRLTSATSLLRPASATCSRLPSVVISIWASGRGAFSRPVSAVHGYHR
jgi:hypothetical protein